MKLIMFLRIQHGDPKDAATEGPKDAEPKDAADVELKDVEPKDAEPKDVDTEGPKGNIIRI